MKKKNVRAGTVHRVMINGRSMPVRVIRETGNGKWIAYNYGSKEVFHIGSRHLMPWLGRQW